MLYVKSNIPVLVWLDFLQGLCHNCPLAWNVYLVLFDFIWFYFTMIGLFDSIMLHSYNVSEPPMTIYDHLWLSMTPAFLALPCFVSCYQPPSAVRRLRSHRWHRGGVSLYSPRAGAHFLVPWQEGVGLWIDNCGVSRQPSPPHPSLSLFVHR